MFRVAPVRFRVANLPRNVPHDLCHTHALHAHTHTHHHHQLEDHMSSSRLIQCSPAKKSKPVLISSVLASRRVDNVGLAFCVALVSML